MCAMQTSLDSPAIIVPQPEVTIAPRNLTDDKHEEMKCLFLRCRNPPDGAIESLITEIFNYELYSNEAVEIICHSKQVFTDFRSKFNKSIAELVHEFKKRGLEEQISTPSRLDINEFITHEV
ncbi:17600_t:CDS:2 [Cetraspora pellucida]|uniref:17600_t:CDS:1 n=1 Tax=Cetraspora pellucida TaxID=1433469 RepID=A0ACA9M8Q9_9GLOM|nr:17600_t:CDS:2 [Cetraspora pellucida]